MAAENEATVVVSAGDLESIVRRVVREELQRLMSGRMVGILEDWRHEGPEDPEGDAALCREAAAVLSEHPDEGGGWLDWDSFKSQLDESRQT